MAEYTLADRVADSHRPDTQKGAADLPGGDRRRFPWLAPRRAYRLVDEVSRYRALVKIPQHDSRDRIRIAEVAGAIQNLAGKLGRDELTMDECVAELRQVADTVGEQVRVARDVV